MKYKTEELEKMSKEDLIKTYRESKTSVKKRYFNHISQ